MAEASARNPDEDAVYLLADGDDVGNRIELFLLDENVNSARQFSESVSRAVDKSTKLILRSVQGCEIIFVGGDAFLVRLPARESYDKICRQVQSVFQQNSGCTLSIGLGPNTRTAANALRRAKLLGKNRIILLGLHNGER